MRPLERDRRAHPGSMGYTRTFVGAPTHSEADAHFGSNGVETGHTRGGAVLKQLCWRSMLRRRCPSLTSASRQLRAERRNMSPHGKLGEEGEVCLCLILGGEFKWPTASSPLAHRSACVTTLWEYPHRARERVLESAEWKRFLIMTMRPAPTAGLLHSSLARSKPLERRSNRSDP